MYVTIIVGEEARSKVKAFLTAPNNLIIDKGILVKAGSVCFKVKFVDFYHHGDDYLYKALTEALGDAIPITSVIREEAVTWEEET